MELPQSQALLSEERVLRDSQPSPLRIEQPGRDGWGCNQRAIARD